MKTEKEQAEGDKRFRPLCRFLDRQVDEILSTAGVCGTLSWCRRKLVGWNSGVRDRPSKFL